MKRINYLQQNILDKLARLPLKPKSISHNLKKGYHQSRNKGKNMDFKEHREYTYGDEIKDIDWKVYARTEKYFIKDYEEDLNHNILILLDTSSSMRMPFVNNNSKMEYSKFITASLAYLFIKKKDRVCVACFDRDFRIILPPTSNSANLSVLVDKLNQIVSQETLYTDFNLISKSVSIFKNSSVITYIVSDLIADRDEIIKSITTIDSPKNDISIFHLIHDIEEDLKLSGYLELSDPESGKSISAKSSDIKDNFSLLYEEYIKSLSKNLRKINIDYNKFNMSKHYSDNLTDYLKKTY
jgi:uncharacterized protein (DUF58 family)